MTKIILIVGVVLIVILGVFYVKQESAEESDMPAIEEEGESMEKEDGAVMGKNIVVYSDSGFSPKELTIKAGETVAFRNDSSRLVWTATAIHPSHTVYPESSIQKCFDDQADKSLLFDSCGDVQEGQEWSFVFREIGSWNYHNHRRASEWGTIIVE